MQRGKVEPLKARFEAMGLDVFFDLEGIDGGAVFPDVITRALDTSKAVLACWSPLYFTRPWCLIEAREGMSRQILLPVMIEAFDRTAPPADLRHVNYYDLNGWKGEDAHENWDRTLRRLGRLIGRDLAPQLKTGMLGDKWIAQPAPEPPPAVGARIDVLGDLRATWANFPARDNAVAVGRFLKAVQGSAPGSGLEFEVEHHLNELHQPISPEQESHRNDSTKTPDIQFEVTSDRFLRRNEIGAVQENNNFGNLIDDSTAQELVERTLYKSHEGELFIQSMVSETLLFENGQVASGGMTFDQSQGFGIRAVKDDETRFAHNTDFSVEALDRGAALILGGRSGAQKLERNNARNKGHVTKTYEASLSSNLDLLESIDRYARSIESTVHSVSISLACRRDSKRIFRIDQQPVGEESAILRLQVRVGVCSADSWAYGTLGLGSRGGHNSIVRPSNWRPLVEAAFSHAVHEMEAVQMHSGEMPVVLGPGGPAAMISQCVATALEGDYVGQSIFSGRIGERVAGEIVSIVDDGSLIGRRGSMSFDDEGTPTSRTPLIESGVLVNFLMDRTHGRRNGLKTTGNARREGFDRPPQPGKMNTLLLSGNEAPEDIIRSVRNGIYVKGVGAGQIDVTSGQFVFKATEASKISNGRIDAPVKNIMLIGQVVQLLENISMIGGDFGFGPDVLSAGKAGQSTPVSAGQPTIKVDKMLVKCS